MFEKTRRGGGWRIVEWRLAMRKSAERTSKGKREGERCKMQEQQTHRDAKVSTAHRFIATYSSGMIRVIPAKGPVKERRVSVFFTRQHTQFAPLKVVAGDSGCCIPQYNVSSFFSEKKRGGGKKKRKSIIISDVLNTS